ncbi:tail fiber protein [Proteus phage J3S]
MSMIYKEGTASLTKGSPVLKGKDTYFLNPIFNVGVGQIVQVKAGDNVYVNSIKEVVDNETLILSFDSISDVKDGEIVIMITMVDSISDTANKLLGMTRGLVQFETEMTKWFTSMDKKITITLPDGTKKEVYTLQAIMEQVAQNEKEMQELLQSSEKKVNDMVDKAQTDVNNVVTDGTNKINQAVDKADKEINEAITSGTGKIDTMLTESQKKIDKTIEDTEVKVDTELGKIDEKIGNRIDGKLDKTGGIVSGDLNVTGLLQSTGGRLRSTKEGSTINLETDSLGARITSKVPEDSSWRINNLPDHSGKLLADGDYGIGIPTELRDSNLNDIKTPGMYRQDQNSNIKPGLNYPPNNQYGFAGSLEVLRTVGNSGCIQRYTRFNDSKVYQRRYDGSTWSDWDSELLKVGDFGIGSVNRLWAKNLDDVRIGGDYQQDATNEATVERNYPIKEAGALKVTQTVGEWGSGGVIQEYTTYLSARRFIRSRASATWNPWEELPNRHSNETQFFNGQVVSYNGVYVFDKSSPSNYFGLLRAVKGNTYGFFLSYDGVGYSVRFPERKGGTLIVADPQYITHKSVNDWAGIRLYKAKGEYGYIETNTRDNEIFTIGYRNSSDVNQAVLAVPRKTGTLFVRGECGVGASDSPSITEYGDANSTKVINGFYSVLTDQNELGSSHGVGGQAVGVINLGMHNLRSSDFRSQIATSYSRSGRVFFRVSLQDGWKNWREFLHTSNTTFDSNGFVKRASPVIDINSEGGFTTNVESEGATVSRIAQGEYLIEGVLGFNSDAGWGGVDGGIEIPLDNNKLPMIWVDYEVESDGSIILKTYHREHKDVPPFARNLKRGYKDGDPCDIPTGRFVSVRVNMPEDSIYNKKIKEESDLIKEMESNPFYKEERAFPNIIFNKKGDL